MEASKAYLAIVCLGIFAVMALSNAIVPVLPAFAVKIFELTNRSQRMG